MILQHLQIALQKAISVSLTEEQENIPQKSVFQYSSSDPCQLKSTTAQSVDDVIEIPSNKTNPSKVRPANMDTNTIVEVDVEEDDGDDEHAPIQKTIRRGGVSAEAIQEEDLGDYEKKVCIKGTIVQ